jgi:LytR cell envelope-related transcriptional attenuator
MIEESWRNAAIAVTAIAALELVLLAGAAVALLGNPLARHLKAEAAAAAQPRVRGTPRVASPKLERDETAVIVLNGNGRTGAAGAAAERVAKRGYVVADVGNASRTDHTRTLVMYRPGFAGEAARFARDMHVHLVTPLDGMRPRALMGAHLVLIVGT